MVLEVLLPCEPLGDRFLFFLKKKSGKKDKGGSFRNMHILDVLVLLFFFSNVLSFIRYFCPASSATTGSFTCFFKCDFASDE